MNEGSKLHRYLLVAPFAVYTIDEILREHLVMLKEGMYDYIIDLVEGKWFNSKENMWVEVKEDNR